MKLLVYKHDKLISEFTLETGRLYSVGRKEDCDIPLEKGPGISRKHFEIDEDETGLWRVNVLSKVMLLEFEGQEQNSFTLEGHGDFFLKDYRFEFIGEEKFEQYDNNSEIATPANEKYDNFSDIEVFKEDLETPTEEKSEAAFTGSDEKTAVQSFTGVPYIKILGKNGKKSEYFRLEGNLWIIGGDESASIYIKEPSASKNHFEISKTEKGFFVADSGSSQGTDLNGQKLGSKKATRLLSGDIMTIGKTSIQFELRDQAFKRKISNIPMSMYKNPMVFFDENVAMVSLHDEESEPGKAEELSFDPTQKATNTKVFAIRAIAGIVLLVVMVFQFLPQNSDESKNQSIGADPFSMLTPAEQKMVSQTHRLAKQLFLAKNYELSLVQLDKLHEMIPIYKDSKEIEEFCINSRELKTQRAAIEKQRRQQERIENEVRSYIAQCNQRYARSSDIDGVKACLSPASELDPNNSSISQLITDVTARQEEARIRKKVALEQADKIKRGKELYQRARNLHKKSYYLKAIEAYENHIHSGLPDPKKLVRTSKRHLAAIERSIKSKKTQLLGQAESFYKGTQLKDAIYLGRKAQKVDPFDPQISSFVYKTEKELNNKMKSIYMDSVIEERFGNLEASRLKWEEIIKRDVNDGKYYKKARGKLKEYGYKH